MSKEKRETIEDILEELRAFADDSERLNIYDCRNLATDSLRAIADKLGAAHKRELSQLDYGDCAKLRETLKRIVAAAIVAKDANAPEWILQRMADIFAIATTALAATEKEGGAK